MEPITLVSNPRKPAREWFSTEILDPRAALDVHRLCTDQTHAGQIVGVVFVKVDPNKDGQLFYHNLPPHNSLTRETVKWLHGELLGGRVPGLQALAVECVRLRLWVGVCSIEGCGGVVVAAG